MPTKDDVLRSLGNDAIRLDGLTDEQWDEYLDLLKYYLEGSWCSEGWQFTIESAMKRAGATEDQAFVLAAARQNFKGS